MKRRLTALLILLSTTACDNVEWGGIHVALESPDAAADTLGGAVEAEPAEPEGPVIPEGPILFAATRVDGNRVALRALAEIRTDTLSPLPLDRDQPGFSDLLSQERMSAGTRFVLYAEGVRVGSVQVDEVDFQPARCSATPVALGTLELIPDAAAAERFVALREADVDPVPHAPFTDPQHNYDQRVASLALATEAITGSGAPWPGSVLETRADIQAIPLDGNLRGAIAGSFLFQDALRVGPSLTPAAYAIFVLGVGGPTEYRMGYMDYRPVSREKAAMRYYQHADWDGDGEAEILVEVFGEEARWMMALDRRGGNWTRVFEETCGPAPSGD